MGNSSLCADSGTFSTAPPVVPPQDFLPTIGTRQHTRQHEQQVGQAVEIPDRLAAHRFQARQRNGLALGPAHDGTGQMAARSGLATGRQG